jgi:hypothetical protein
VAAAKPIGQPATAPVAPPLSGAVALTAVQPVWLKVYEKSGPTLFMGEMAPGQRFEVPATANDPQIRTGRPQAVQVTVGGKPVPALGKADRTIGDVSLKPDALLARSPTAIIPTPVKPVPATPPAAQVTPVDPTPVPAAAPPPATTSIPRP